jgi:cell division septation protein DedD
MRNKEMSSNSGYLQRTRVLLGVLLCLIVSACTTDLQMKVSGNLNQLSRNQTVAILPIEIANNQPIDAANLFRQSLHANLQESNFHLLEHYIVDQELEKNGLTDPSKFSMISPMHLGEVLGVDAVVISRLNRVERSYFLLHSSIEISVSVSMVDTRTGEILWHAEQTESDYQGIGKIPTGIFAAILAPIYFVTNKLNLDKLTSTMVDKLTGPVKNPEELQAKDTFNQTVIAFAASGDIEKIKRAEKVRTKFDQITIDEPAKKLKRVALKELVVSQLEPAIELTHPNRSDIPVQPAIKPRIKQAEYRVQQVKFVETDSVDLHALIEKERQEAIKITASKKPERELNTTTRVVKQSTFAKQSSAIHYTIQVGAYKTQRFAQKLFNDLVNKGYNVFIRPFKNEETQMYRVQVEAFEDKVDAVIMAKTIRSEEHIPNFVTQVD